MRGTYTGEVKHLKGFQALLQPHTAELLKAQFDKITLVLDPKGFGPYPSLGLGWHAFPIADWQVDPEVEWDE